MNLGRILGGILSLVFAISFINNIDDPDLRIIFRKRFIDLETWEKIGEKLNYDRTVVAKKCRKYIKQQNAHKTH